MILHLPVSCTWNDRRRFPEGFMVKRGFHTIPLGLAKLILMFWDVDFRSPVTSPAFLSSWFSLLHHPSCLSSLSRGQKGAVVLRSRGMLDWLNQPGSWSIHAGRLWQAMAVYLAMAMGGISSKYIPFFARRWVQNCIRGGGAAGVQTYSGNSFFGYCDDFLCHIHAAEATTPSATPVAAAWLT